MNKTLKDYALLTAGTLMTSVGIYFFKVPNHFSTGGVSGISVILSGIFPNLSFGAVMLAINVFLLIVGFFAVGRGFGIKTVYCSLLLSVSTYILEFLYPMRQPFTDQPLLELIYAVLLPGIGSAIIFNCDGSTGGTDIVAMILKRHTDLNISISLMSVDFIITFLTFFVFDIKTGMLSLLGLVARVTVIDKVIENINTSKFFTIITDQDEEITDFITTQLKKGVTVVDACHGGFTNSPKKVIYTVLPRFKAVHLKKQIKQTDPHAFVIICNTGDIIGKGFRASM